LERNEEKKKMKEMNPITIYQPGKIVFGANTIGQLPGDCRLSGYKKVMLIFTSPLKSAANELAGKFENLSIRAELVEYRFGEPTVDYFNTMLARAKTVRPDCVIGIGGGSVLDTAKLVAALWNSEQNIRAVFGKNLLQGRECGLICIPTTSGTGSEVSPNAILLDESDAEKKGVISPFLVPDSCYIDPELQLGLPLKITAETAMDALSHCIEAYTNKFSHPVTDIYALTGIKLITGNLAKACQNGSDLDARSALALGSMYGGMCLGPVNTAAVHALSYGLGGKYHVSHGLANAILLPEVMRFNLDACPEKYEAIARAIGVNTAEEGIEKIQALSIACGIPQKLTEIGVLASDIACLADLAMKVTRLLVNNPKEVKREDAIEIYSRLILTPKSPEGDFGDCEAKSPSGDLGVGVRAMKPIIGITMGDPAGIGPEVIVKSLGNKKIYETCKPLVFADAKVMQAALKFTSSPLSIHPVSAVNEAVFEYGKIDVFDLKNVDLTALEQGKVSAMAGHAAFESIRKVINSAMQGEIDATVTAPINKESIHLAGHYFSGHTEIYAHFTQTKKYAMLLADDALRIIHVTTHVPLHEACELITQERISDVIALLHEACVSFGIEHPKIGVAGLNPHAGDGGLFGKEDEEIIRPAVQKAQASAYLVDGPIPPDTLFSKAIQGKYDGCVAMYHDQGHIPFKLVGFKWNNQTQAMDSVKGVNITLGLPIIRTSVDHGTAFEIAGKGIASEDAMTIAIQYAIQMAANKKRINE
jgi:4-hydroxythreonine-4-phosphate dehydrogenase